MISSISGTGVLVAYNGGLWRVVAIHSLGIGGLSRDTYDLKSLDTGVVVCDIPDFNLDSINILPRR